jgi:hypothetical protein
MAGAGAADAIPMLALDLGGGGASAAIQVGDTIQVAVRADEIPSAGDGLFGFGFAITFAASGLSAGAPVIDAGWTGNTGVTNTAGRVGATANLLGSASGPSGSGIALATIAFTGLANGVYTLQLEPLTGPGDNVLFDGTCLDAADGAACTGANAAFFGSATLTVPEPGVLALLIAGASALRSRRRERSPHAA